MKWFKDGLRSLKDIDWIRMEYILIVTIGIFWRAAGHGMAEFGGEGRTYMLLTGELWLTPLLLYICIRNNSVNREILQNRNARRVLLLFFIAAEIIAVAALASDPQLSEAFEWFREVARQNGFIKS